MRALLLAAGMGTRLRPITDVMPKCLVPIHGRQLLAYWLDLLFEGGIDRVLINTHYLPDAVRSFVADSHWQARVDLVHEQELLGTGGTVAANHAYFRGEPFLVAHADNLTDFNLSALCVAHETRPPGVAMTLLAFHTDYPRSCGILELDSSGVVRSFHEKVENPPGDLANAAVYILEPEVTAYALALNKPVIDLSTEIVPAFLGRILAHETAGYHRDIGSVENLRKAHLEFPRRGRSMAGVLKPDSPGT
jgi:mannose-1-phosphate guanylyltransferase